MSSHLAASPLVFSPQASSELTGVGRLPAAPDAARRFEQLFFAPGSGPQAAATSHAIGEPSLRNYIEQLSMRWEAGQSSLQNMIDAGKFTSKELVLTQIQMINCALDVEVSSKCASMLESGVQTLIQRGS